MSDEPRPPHVGSHPKHRPSVSKISLPGDSPQISPNRQPKELPPAISIGSAPPASPYEMKEEDKDAKKLVATTKSYRREDFLNSGDARILRILCEFQEPAQRLASHDVRGTILFFGSARSMNQTQYTKTLQGLEKDLVAAEGNPNAKKALETKIAAFKKVEWMCPFVDVVQELAQRLTHWSRTDEALRHLYTNTTNYLTGHTYPAGECDQPLIVTTGGGPGIMEAANKGARQVPGAITMGMGISLPFEKGLNPYVTPDLAFEFHYFFTRKFWMMYSAKALILGPGGFGTMDELFELMTLKQTGKLPELPIVLLGTRFWKTVVNWQALADFGVISQKEVDNFCFTDNADEAFNFITKEIVRYAQERRDA